MIEAMDLERVLQLSAAIFFCGVAGLIWALGSWAGRNFGPITDSIIIRVLIVSLMATAVSIQVAASAFLASVLTIRRPTRDN